MLRRYIKKCQAHKETLKQNFIRVLRQEYGQLKEIYESGAVRLFFHTKYAAPQDLRITEAFSLISDETISWFIRANIPRPETAS